MQTLLKCLLSSSNLGESLTFSDFAHRGKENLFDTMLHSLLKEIVIVNRNFAFCQEVQTIWVNAKAAKGERRGMTHVPFHSFLVILLKCEGETFGYPCKMVFDSVMNVAISNLLTYVLILIPSSKKYLLSTYYVPVLDSGNNSSEQKQNPDSHASADKYI